MPVKFVYTLDAVGTWRETRGVPNRSEVIHSEFSSPNEIAAHTQARGILQEWLTKHAKKSGAVINITLLKTTCVIEARTFEAYLEY